MQETETSNNAELDAAIAELARLARLARRSRLSIGNDERNKISAALAAIFHAGRLDAAQTIARLALAEIGEAL